MTSGVGRSVCQNQVTLALSRFPVGVGAVVAYQRFGISLGQPVSLLATSEPCLH